MKLHEYQGKALLRQHGVSTLAGAPARSADEAVAAAESLGGSVWVVKSQVHAGGRGKGRFKHEVADAVLEQVLRGEDNVPGKGGVRVCTSLDAVRTAANAMLG